MVDCITAILAHGHSGPRPVAHRRSEKDNQARAVQGEWRPVIPAKDVDDFESGLPQHAHDLRRRIEPNIIRPGLAPAIGVEHRHLHRHPPGHEVQRPLLQDDDTARVVPATRLKMPEDPRLMAELQQKAPAQLQCPGYRAQHARILGVALEVPPTAEEVERAIVSHGCGNGAHIGLDPLDWGIGALGAPGRQSQQRGREVQPGHLIAAPRQLDGVAARAAGDVQNVRAGGQTQRPRRELHLGAGPLDLAGEDEIHIFAELFKHALIPVHGRTRSSCRAARCPRRRIAQASPCPRRGSTEPAVSHPLPPG